jgi:outer membrane protein assembly factor BamD
MKRVWLCVLLVLGAFGGGCTTPPANDDRPSPGPATEGAARSATAGGALGSAAGATWKDIPGKRATAVGGGEKALSGGALSSEQRLQVQFDAAKALDDQGDHLGAALAFEKIHTFAPKSRLGEESFFAAAEACFKGDDDFRALEHFEQLLRDYPTTTHYPETLDRIFAIGKLFVEEKATKPSWLLGLRQTDRAYGIEVLERFVKQRDQHPNASYALFLIGEARVRGDEPELAIESWQRLIKEYPPPNPWARQAEYRIALAFLALSYGIDYDKRPILTGLRRLRAYVRKYPNGDNVREAEERLTALEEALAGHDLKIARRYARDSHYVSAQVYLNAIRREYPKTAAASDAARLAQEWPDPPAPPAPDEKK